MKRIRVLVVDDAVAVRRLVSEALSSDPSVEVAGVAANGRIGLSRIAQLSPDVITLDLEMPEMDGLQTLIELRRTYPTLPVIMLSSYTKRGARQTLEALARGATDYVPKPDASQSATATVEYLKRELLPRVRVLGGLEGVPAVPSSSPSRRTEEAARPLTLAPLPRGPRRVDVVVIGVSTGGPNALAATLSTLPADFPVPVLIVQHMPALFTGMLAERLRSVCKLDVQEATSGTTVEPGRILIAPGEFHMVVQRVSSAVSVMLHQAPPENSCRPSVDVLFRSVPAVWGANVLAAVLTGMGKDGLAGCREIAAAGGQIVVQDRATSIVWGMPGFVADAGLASAVLPLDDVGPEILRRVQEGRGTTLPCSPGPVAKATR
jgi:two-component system, chemotaxis family, protein-glutamate methylesterase/glutaminase